MQTIVQLICRKGKSLRDTIADDPRLKDYDLTIVREKKPGRYPGWTKVRSTAVSQHGFWLLLQDRELFIAFKEFPWFRDASIAELSNVELPQPHHLYWPDLNSDLAVESIEHPEKYPLVSKIRPNRTLQRTGRRAIRR